MTEHVIAIRSIQHYLYCPHRWGLLEINKAWAENAFVTKANLIHERVHNPEKQYSGRGKKVFTCVPVYNDEPEYNLYGVADCIEAVCDEKGVEIGGIEGKYKLCIVEYKPTKPKDRDYNEDDLLQVFAQKLCVDYIFGCDCEAVIYYSDVKKRMSLPLSENYQACSEKLVSTLSEMRRNISDGYIPPIKKDRHCSGCSMKDICMPSLRKTDGIRETIRSLSEDLM